MADVWTSRDRKLILSEMPDEILLKIFSHISLPDLDLKFAKVCRRWARIAQEKSLRTSVEVKINYDNQASYGRTVEFLNNSLKKYGTTASLVRIKPSGGQRASCSDIFNWSVIRKAEYEFFKKFYYSMLPLGSCIETLVLESYHYTSCMFKSNLSNFLRNPTLRTVIFINREESWPCGVDFSIAISIRKNSLNLKAKNINRFQLEHWLYFYLFGNIILASYFTSLALTPNSYQLRNNNCLRIYDYDFRAICLCCPELETLCIYVSDVLALDDFYNLNFLKKLKRLQVTMDYSFSRLDLLMFFGLSSFTGLSVTIKEIRCKGLREQIELKGGLITVRFCDKNDL